MNSLPQGKRSTHHLDTRLRDVLVGVPVLVLFIDPPEGARVIKGIVMDVWDDGLQVECIHWDRAERPTHQIFSESGLRSLACYNPERS
jgi:hypothetical protein